MLWIFFFLRITQWYLSGKVRENSYSATKAAAPMRTAEQMQGAFVQIAHLAATGAAQPRPNRDVIIMVPVKEGLCRAEP